MNVEGMVIVCVFFAMYLIINILIFLIVAQVIKARYVSRIMELEREIKALKGMEYDARDLELVRE